MSAPDRVARLARLLRTIAHLRPVQVYGRIWFRLYRPRPSGRGLPALALPGGHWSEPARREPSLLGRDTARFLAQTHPIGSPADWSHPARTRLWLYNLHYFDDLNAQDWPARLPWQRALIERWVQENRPFAGTGWEPYPASLRIVNWLKWGLAGNRLEAHWAASLALQTRYLRRRIEWYLLGNHLLANAKALVFAGICFDGAEAAEWLRTGLGILARQLPEQLLPDGGHFERSPMYQALVLEDLLDLCNLVRALGTGPDLAPGLASALTDAAAGWAEAASEMAGWLAALCHPDGQIALFNDAAFGVAPGPAELTGYARRLGLPPAAPPRRPLDRRIPSGYLRVALGPALALLDVGEIGPDYLPGHAHADTLSFELSLWGHRVIVDSGTSCYGSGPERLRQRGTAAHNTVEIDGADSSEIWGGFRVARRARPLGLQIDESPHEIRVACSHDGFKRLPGRPVHWREWRVTSHSLTIRDRIEGRARCAVARLHLHPGVTAELAPDGCSGWLRAGECTCRWSVRGAARVRLVPSSHHPRFGVCEPSLCLELELGAAELETTLEWGEPPASRRDPPVPTQTRASCTSSS